MNYYEILEVSPKASPEVLKAAYKSLIQRYHPDRNPGDQKAAERSQSVVQAYQELSDPSRRAAYDLELQRQSEIRDNRRTRTREVMARAPAEEPKRESHRFYWGVVAAIAVGLWFVWPSAKNGHPSGPPLVGESKNEAAVQSGFQPSAEQGQTGQGGQSWGAPSARTIPNYVENLHVSLEPPAKPADTPSAAARHVLSIKSVGVVVGAFDGDKFVSFLEQNKEYIGRRLAEKLASADYERLVKDRERYLKRLILDSLGEITNTKRSEKSALPGAASAAPYGAVEILLPDSFAVESQEANQVTVQIWTAK